MIKLSTGQDSTLKTYRNIAIGLCAGKTDCKAVEFFDKKIKESKNGEDEEVLANEQQMIVLILAMVKQDIESGRFDICPCCKKDLTKEG